MQPIDVIKEWLLTFDFACPISGVRMIGKEDIANSESIEQLNTVANDAFCNYGSELNYNLDKLLNIISKYGCDCREYERNLR